MYIISIDRINTICNDFGKIKQEILVQGILFLRKFMMFLMWS